MHYETVTKELVISSIYLRQAKEQSEAAYLCKSEAVVFAFLVFTKSLERSRFSSVLVSTAANSAWLCSAIPNKRLNKGELLAPKEE